jgi:hypothetical protein
MVSLSERKITAWPTTIASQRLREPHFEIFPLLASQSLQLEYCDAGTDLYFMTSGKILLATSFFCERPPGGQPFRPLS